MAAEELDVDVGDGEDDMGDVIPWPSTSWEVKNTRIHEVIKPIMNDFRFEGISMTGTRWNYVRCHIDSGRAIGMS